MNRYLETSGTQKLRRMQGVITPGPVHWVGDGFLVRTVFDPIADPQLISPFLLMDHAAPKHFDPAYERRGVGEHPHRGFETVTFAYQGEVEHRDSTGAGGRIGPGDVQWMTAASGVVHEEKHSQRFTEEGGVFEMVQLWVNLPTEKKMSEPRYQALLDSEFPRLRMGAAEARIIAGSYEGQKGPAKTHTPITVIDLRFERGGTAQLQLPTGWTALAFALDEDVTTGEQREAIPSRHVAVFDSEDDGAIQLHANEGSRILVLSGEPIDEPVVAYGPFVMNTREEIMTAMLDYQSGKMGHLAE